MRGINFHNHMFRGYLALSFTLAFMEFKANCCEIINHLKISVLFFFILKSSSLLWLVQIMYSNLSPSGSLKLYHFIAMVTAVMIALSQFPTFHSLRHINLVSLLLSLGYTFLVVGACIRAGKPPSTAFYPTKLHYI